MPSPLTRDGHRTTRNFAKPFATNADGRPRRGCVGILNTMRTYVRSHFVLAKKGGKHRTPKKKMACRLISEPQIRLTEGPEIRRDRMESLLVDLMKARMVGVLISEDEERIRVGVGDVQTPEQRERLHQRLRQVKGMILGYTEGQRAGLRRSLDISRIKAMIQLAHQWLKG